MPWEFDFSGAPWRTQGVVRTIATSEYTLSPAGEPGNDDLGAMASWEVWADLGLYPLTPGTGTLVVSSPMFPEATVHLAGGRELRILARGAPAPYVASASGQPGRPGHVRWIGPGPRRDGPARGDRDRSTSRHRPIRPGVPRQVRAPPSYSTSAAPAVGFTEPSGTLRRRQGHGHRAPVGAQSRLAGAVHRRVDGVGAGRRHGHPLFGDVAAGRRDIGRHLRTGHRGGCTSPPVGGAQWRARRLHRPGSHVRYRR